MDEHICGGNTVHQDIVDRVSASMPDGTALNNAAELLKVFGDPTRLGIIAALCRSEMCVCDIARLLGMTQSAISHQLRVLKQARLVTTRREGKTIFYSLCDEHVERIFDCALDHAAERTC
ncbi:MAG: metalloregulator ArsR/SmtB family transcription factor [Ruminococcus sp.]|nr:metalloregulator ArsR/SmtB family transcription factor [Ruminococcus sp.]